MNPTPPIDFAAQLRSGIEASIATHQALLADATLLQCILDVGNLMVQAFRNGNRVIFAGNGSSATDAQHFAAEFVSRFEFDRPGLPSLSLSTDTSMLTAIGAFGARDCHRSKCVGRRGRRAGLSVHRPRHAGRQAADRVGPD